MGPFLPPHTPHCVLKWVLNGHFKEIKMEQHAYVKFEDFDSFYWPQPRSRWCLEICYTWQSLGNWVSNIGMELAIVFKKYKIWKKWLRLGLICFIFFPFYGPLQTYFSAVLLKISRDTFFWKTKFSMKLIFSENDNCQGKKVRFFFS